MVQDRCIRYCQIISEMGWGGDVIFRLRFEDDGKMAWHLVDETLGNVHQRGFSLNIAWHHIARHNIFALSVIQLLRFEHDAVKMELVSGCREVDVFQLGIAIQMFEVSPLHMNGAIQRNAFSYVFVCDIQIVRSTIFKYHIQIYSFCRAIYVCKIRIGFHILIMDVCSAGNFCGGAFCVQVDVLIIVAVIVDIVNCARCFADREWMYIVQIHGKVEVEWSSAKPFILLQFANVDAVTTDGTCQKVLLVVHDIIGGMSNARREIAPWNPFSIGSVIHLSIVCDFLQSIEKALFMMVRSKSVCQRQHIITADAQRADVCRNVALLFVKGMSDASRGMKHQVFMLGADVALFHKYLLFITCSWQLKVDSWQLRVDGWEFFVEWGKVRRWYVTIERCSVEMKRFVRLPFSIGYLERV